MKSRDRVTMDDARCMLDGESLPLTNLSLGGFFVATERPLIPGQIVALRVLVADREIPVIGKIAWVNEKASPRHPSMPAGFGVSITRIDLTDKVALVDILRRRSRRPGSAPGTSTPR
jgi:Tfp pilus assembly protein PilZ